MCQGDGESGMMYSYAQEAKAIKRNANVMLPTSSSNGATRWVVGGSLGNTVAFRWAKTSYCWLEKYFAILDIEMHEIHGTLCFENRHV